MIPGGFGSVLRTDLLYGIESCSVDNSRAKIILTICTSDITFIGQHMGNGRRGISDAIGVYKPYLHAINRVC